MSLLLSGVQLPHVSILLGHASVKIAERHYAPWVKARPDRLMLMVGEIVRTRGLTQAQAAKLFGVSQPRVSDVVRGRVSRFTIDALVEMPARAGVRLGIVQLPASAQGPSSASAACKQRQVPARQHPTHAALRDRGWVLALPASLAFASPE